MLVGVAYLAGSVIDNWLLWTPSEGRMLCFRVTEGQRNVRIEAGAHERSGRRSKTRRYEYARVPGYKAPAVITLWQWFGARVPRNAEVGCRQRRR